MADVATSVLALPWEEDECLEYYGMFSLRQLFDVIGSQLTESDVHALSFLLNESYSSTTHPLDPSIWTVEEAGEMPSIALLSAWNKWNRCSKPGNDLEFAEIQRPKNGIQLLYELEKRGYCAEDNFRHLLQLLRVLTRHDLLPYVSLRRRRPVSPERYTYGPSIMDQRKQVNGCLNPTTSQSSEENWETGSIAKKRKRSGNVRRGRCQKPKKSKVSSTPEQAEPTQNKVTCGNECIRRNLLNKIVNT
ncbi:unnamed protein product [Staurois parvus]|uniref:DED domain-containing protein n=1 Tax=Staurois parvus TaxID=386267 RepID=A0ABN9ENV6_9NEOB|nr:unnamed protein product [Staurois parvus]